MKRQLFALASLFIIMDSAMAASAPSALSLPGYLGNINNNSNYVVECSQVIGGYCANNPMPANGYIQMLPDPGSQQIQGHLMIYQKNVPGQYLDNIIFDYYENSNGQWVFTTHSLYNQVRVSHVYQDILVISPK